MGGWNPFGFPFYCLLNFVFSLLIRGALSLNPEGAALLEFRAKIESDPYGSFASWNPLDSDPCLWFGVHCVDGNVQILNLSELSLKGNLAPELGKLYNLRTLVLYKNQFYGTVPEELGELTDLELLDLRDNDLGGIIPVEIGNMLSLTRLLICGNKFEGSIPLDLGRLKMLSELQFDINLTYSVDSDIRCVNRKVGHCICSSLERPNRAESVLTLINRAILHYVNMIPFHLLKLHNGSPAEHENYADITDEQSFFTRDMVLNARNKAQIVRRRLLEQTQNLPAAPADSASSADQTTTQPITRSSGSFPAMPKDATKQPPPSTPFTPAPRDLPAQGIAVDSSKTSTEASHKPSSSGNLWKYLLIIPCVAVLVIFVLFLIYRKKAKEGIGPWKTGISGQLQKAFVSGVPKLNRAELETACEDFSNIIDTVDGCTIYKGTLSSGVEIAVVSTPISSKEWTKNLDVAYHRRIDLLSRINHKNFVNLIGYCVEDEPFIRVMVVEYAPNASLYDHLHVKEMEHLDWSTRMRIVMGVAYCLQYMHHDLNPPVSHSHLSSTSVMLTDDYAAKVAEAVFNPEITSKSKALSDDESENSVSELPPNVDPETNIYSFGIILLEVISGKLPYLEEHGPIEKWASQYLNEKKSLNYLIDPTLKSFKTEELEAICEIAQECIKPDPRQRPLMKDITSRLRQVTCISPDQATPKLSPMWWAELEILSVEAT